MGKVLLFQIVNSLVRESRLISNSGQLLIYYLYYSPSVKCCFKIYVSKCMVCEEHIKVHKTLVLARKTCEPEAMLISRT